MSYTEDMFGARQERDKGMARVTAGGGDWQERCVVAISRLPSGFRGTGEAIKIYLINNRMLEKPYHYNCWGPAIDKARKVGLLRKTTEFAQGTTRSSHGRPNNTVYEVTW